MVVFCLAPFFLAAGCALMITSGWALVATTLSIGFFYGVCLKEIYPNWCHYVGSSANSYTDEYDNKGNYNSNSEIRSKKLAFECSPHHDYESVECNNLCPDN